MWLAATNGNRGGKKKSKRLGSLQQKPGANQSAVARQPPERGRAEFCLCAGARRCAPVGGRAMNSRHFGLSPCSPAPTRVAVEVDSSASRSRNGTRRSHTRPYRGSQRKPYRGPLALAAAIQNATSETAAMHRGNCPEHQLRQTTRAVQATRSCSHRGSCRLPSFPRKVTHIEQRSIGEFTNEQKREPTPFLACGTPARFLVAGGASRGHYAVVVAREKAIAHH